MFWNVLECVTERNEAQPASTGNDHLSGRCLEDLYVVSVQDVDMKRVRINHAVGKEDVCVCVFPASSDTARPSDAMRQRGLQAR